MSSKLLSTDKRKSILHVLIGIYAISTLVLSWLFYFVTPDNAVFAFIRSGYLLVLIPTLIICLLIIAFIPNRTLLLLLLPNLAIALSYVTPHLIPSFVSTPDDNASIRVMTYNILNPQDEQMLDTYADLIRESNPDIIAFQELSRVAHDGLRARIGNDYPYFETEILPEWWQSGQGVYSKFPIVDEIAWVDEDLNMTHPHQRLLIDVNGVEVVFYNIHPYPPIEWVSGFQFVITESEMNAHGIAMQRIINRVQLETLPVLVAGDMNMSDQFPEYRRLSAVLTDSFKSGGFGLGFTYPANNRFPELMRLDYIFHSDDFQTLTARVLTDSGTSDHLPVIADLVLH